MQGRLRLGVDTGGTFTDLVLDPGGGSPLVTHKLLSTPDDPARAVLLGVQEILGKWAGHAGKGSLLVIHGSTVATNALLEGKGARAAFVTTQGFEDTLFIGRQNRSELYALEPAKPMPPLEDNAALGVVERVDAHGAVLLPLAEAEVARLVERVRALGVEAVAVSLLHSYANPGHEKRIVRALAAALPGLQLAVSHELLPEFREYERGATCLINAVVAPQMASYVRRLSSALGEGALRVMASAGGTLPPAVVERIPAHTILSGPAGGVLGALAQARAAGTSRIITLDMGGTSTDVALCDGAPRWGTEQSIAGLPLRLPALDIHTVGAGGGSIAWLDSGGALRVGPQSVGADPGPACYGRQRGALTAAVTDAHVVLGHLPADATLAGSLRLDCGAARAAVGRIAAQAGLGLERMAEGILRVAEAAMARAVQRITLERGFDPREFTLVPFGGAGGLHAARLAEQLGLRQILVPTMPGLLSAMGMLCAAPLYAFSQGVMLRLTPERAPLLESEPAVRGALEKLQALAHSALAADGVPQAEWVLRFSADLRYAGQSYELIVPLGAGDPLATFARQHRELYGYDAPERDVEVVAVRLLAGGTPRDVALPELSQRPSRFAPEQCGAPVALLTEGKAVAAWRFQRDALCAGDVITGPAMVAEYSGATLIPPGWRARVNEYGMLLMEQAGPEGGADD